MGKEVFMQKNVFFIGLGNMGGAIVNGLIQSQFSSENILFLEPNPEAALKYEQIGLQRVLSFEEGIQKANVIFICVKPQIFNELADSWKVSLDPDNIKLFISIMAGISSEKIKQKLPHQEVLRVMPNLPLTIQKGTIALANDTTSEKNLNVAENLFKNMGTTVQVPEHLMDAVTGLSGSGPAYVFDFIEGLILGGVKMGLDREAAKSLTISTIEGAVGLFKNSNQEATSLIEMVSSPGGTTVAGLQILKDNSFREILTKTVEAATQRSKELG